MPNIRNLEQIEAVLLHGISYDRATLDRILKQVESDARALEGT